MTYRRARFPLIALVLATSALTAGCTATIGEPTGTPGSTGGPGQTPGQIPGQASRNQDPAMAGLPATAGLGAASADLGRNARAFGRAGVRRLSLREYASTVRDILRIEPTTAELALFPPDPGAPFDNDYAEQNASAAWIEGAKGIADRLAGRLTADASIRGQVVPCVPAGPTDGECFKSFVAAVGRKVLRRPLSAQEIADYTALHKFSVQGNDFFVGIGLVLRALLQSPEFLYRIEIGTPVAAMPDLFRLNGFEVASRLSYFLWGTTPDETLLAKGEANLLGTAAQIQDAARIMLNSPKARERINDFHAAWLGYRNANLPLPLAAAMRRESDALVERVVFTDRAPWVNLFTADSTFVDDKLASHYGLPVRGGAARWEPYGNNKRRGLLSHGSVLSNGAKFGDTSPVQRGLFVRRRFMCQDIPSPPPTLGVKADEPPASVDPKACKAQRYAVHRAGACAGCHEKMDSLGFGLENFDDTGAFRSSDKGRPDCPIDGKGVVSGVGMFEGPGELARLLVDSKELDACFATHFYRFAGGRDEGPDDAAGLAQLTADFRKGDHHLDMLLLNYVSAAAFRHRWAE